MNKRTLSLIYTVILILLPHVKSSSSQLRKLSVTLLGKNVKKQKEPQSSKVDWTSFYQTIPLRPSSSLMVPLDIEERPNKDLDPDLSTLDEIQLLKLLGDDYDRHYMSIRQPAETALFPDGILHYGFDSKLKPSKDDMPIEIQALSNREVRLSDRGPALRVKFSKKIKNKMQKFLWAYSYCPVRYKWKQLSERFWPRWIRTGTCDNKRSCSIPAGMTCQPSRMRDIRILRYYCPIKNSRSSCQWIKFEYPVLDKCNCACEANSLPPTYYN